jgi:hypothetical protein
MCTEKPGADRHIPGKGNEGMQISSIIIIITIIIIIIIIISVMWKQNTVKVIPIVISSTAVIPKSLSQSLKRLNLHPNTYIQMQKSVILGTCSIVRNFLNYK